MKPKPKGPFTTVHLDRNLWALLRLVALQRSLKRGTRVSVSEVIGELIDRNRAELEKEARSPIPS